MDTTASKFKTDPTISSISYVVSLKYPATANFTGGYASSRDAGVTALKAELNYYWATCQVRPMVYLAGYSQGADVVALTMAQIASGPRGMVKGAALFGDPAYRSGDDINHPNRPYGGIFSRAAWDRTTLNNLRSLGWDYDAPGVWGWRQIVRSYCANLDAVCQSNVLPSGWGTHASAYGQSATDAFAWMKNFILWG